MTTREQLLLYQQRIIVRSYKSREPMLIKRLFFEEAEAVTKYLNGDTEGSFGERLDRALGKEKKDLTVKDWLSIYGTGRE